MSDPIEQYFVHLGIFPDEKWAVAPCTTALDPDAWFEVDAGFGADDLYRLKMALNTCNSCPLRSECLELGMEEDNLAFGIWGGAFPSERLILAGKGRYTATQRKHETTMKLRRKLNIYREEVTA